MFPPRSAEPNSFHNANLTGGGGSSSSGGSDPTPPSVNHKSAKSESNQHHQLSALANSKSSFTFILEFKVDDDNEASRGESNYYIVNVCVCACVR
jgi:hypothetical protein